MLPLYLIGLMRSQPRLNSYPRGVSQCTAILPGIFCGALLLLTALPTRAELKDSPKALVDEAWQVVYRDYVDRTFNQQDWLQVRQDYLQRSYTSSEQAYDAIREMLEGLDDPFTGFLSSAEIKSLVSDVSGEFVGVGLTVGLDERTREWVVISPIKGAPAEIAGIKPRDVITQVNGQATPDIDTSKIGKYLIGTVGSQVFINLRRNGQDLQFKLVREPINLNPLTYQTKTTAAGRIGYLALPVFTSKSAAEMEQAIKELEQQQVKGYILDLRGNPGGVLDAAFNIGQLWLRQGQLMSLVAIKGKQERYQAQTPPLTRKPLVVLVDGESASASEVLAGALQDQGRAQLVGSRTFGKGLIQTLATLEDSSGVRISIARYYTPKGRDIHQVGLEPNIVVPLSESERESLLRQRGVATPIDKQYGRALKELLKQL